MRHASDARILPIHAPFDYLPLCETHKQTGCVITYNSYLQGDGPTNEPPTTFGEWAGTETFNEQLFGALAPIPLDIQTPFMAFPDFYAGLHDGLRGVHRAGGLSWPSLGELRPCRGPMHQHAGRSPSGSILSGRVALVQQSSPKPAAARARVVASFYLALALGGFLWHAIAQEDNDCWRASGVSNLELLWTPLLGVALGLGVVVAFRMLERRWSWLPTLHREFREILGRPTWAELLLLAGASAFGEEILFRGAMLDAWGPWLSSLVFALLHVPPRRELWPWTVSAGLLGLCLAGLTLWTGNLGAAVAAHFVINMINLAYITRRAPAVALRGPIRPRSRSLG